MILAALVAEEAAGGFLQYQQLRTNRFISIRGRGISFIPLILRDIPLCYRLSVYEVVVLAALVAEEGTGRLLQHQKLQKKGLSGGY
jgi:hypothetical protein